MKRLASIALLLASTGMAAAQFTGPGLVPSKPSTPQVVTTDPALLYPAVQDAVLSAGDEISVRVLGPGDYATTVRVAADGTAQFPLIGVIKIGGLTITGTEQLIAHDLIADGMFRDPQVIVILTENASSAVAVVGEVHGIVPVVGQRLLLQVLAAAGGLPPTASHVITIDRPGVAEPITVDIGTDPARSALANIPVYPGDTIVTSRLGVVYVIGAFKTQGVVQLAGNSPLTLLEIAALSGGPNYEGKYDDLRIIRTNGGQRSLIRVDMKKVLYGRAPDPILQADDIIFLPSSAIKSALVNGGVSTLFGAASLLISFISLSRN